MFATSESLQTCTQRSLEQKPRQMLNSHPEMPKTRLGMFNLLARSQNLRSLSGKNLRLKSLSSARFSVARKNNPEKFLQNLRLKRGQRMKSPSRISSRRKKRTIYFQSLLCCASVHFRRMKSQSLEEVNGATWPLATSFVCKASKRLSRSSSSGKSSPSRQHSKKFSIASFHRSTAPSRA